MQTWVVIARDVWGQETRIGLVVASDARTAFYRGVIKATRLLGADARRQVTVRPTQ